MWHFWRAKVVQKDVKSHAVGTQVWDFCPPKVPHLQFRIYNLELFQQLSRCKAATYGEGKQEAIFSTARCFFRGDAILEVDTSVKVF